MTTQHCARCGVTGGEMAAESSCNSMCGKSHGSAPCGPVVLVIKAFDAHGNMLDWSLWCWDCAHAAGFRQALERIDLSVR